MFRSVELPEPVLDNLADQIAESLPPSLDDRPGFELGDTFEIWNLVSWSPTLNAAPTGAYHHQILLDGVAVAYARSSPEQPGGPPQIEEVTQSPLAGKIEKALDALDGDSSITDDEDVKLLVARSFAITALWFGQSYYVVSVPSTAKFLKVGKLSAQDFQQKLGGEKQFRGFAFDPNRRSR